jgi:hypothetical protein
MEGNCCRLCWARRSQRDHERATRGTTSRNRVFWSAVRVKVDDSTGGGGREARAVGRDVVDGVGCHSSRIDDDVGYECAVEEGLDTQAGEGGARVGVGVRRGWRWGVGRRWMVYLITSTISLFFGSTMTT